MLLYGRSTGLGVDVLLAREIAHLCWAQNITRKGGTGEEREGTRPTPPDEAHNATHRTERGGNADGGVGSLPFAEWVGIGSMVTPHHHGARSTWQRRGAYHLGG